MAMEPDTFLIPKQTDESLLKALGLIRAELQGTTGLEIRVTPHHGAAEVVIRDAEPARSEAVAYVVSEHSEIMPYLKLCHPQPTNPQNWLEVVRVRRLPEGVADEAKVLWREWAAQLPPQGNSHLYVKAMSLARKHLRAIDLEAGFAGTQSTAWDRYRDSQQAVLKSLQETTQGVLTDAHEQILQLEDRLTSKYADLEKELRQKYESEQKRLTAEHEQRLKAVGDRETAVGQREKSFNTKEARYVARQGQQQQIDDIKAWLNEWGLTEGTTRKWWAVVGIYGFALVATAGITIWFGIESFGILNKADLAQIHWWQWLSLAIKPILPLAAFITFLVYSIRWFSSWSRQHADEEFRNRARVLDIGRSAWLLEAVRDAQDNAKELPSDLLKELSRNLFVYSVGTDPADLYPEAISDMLMQGLSSLRVKAHDGTEIEAKRGDGKPK